MFSRSISGKDGRRSRLWALGAGALCFLLSFASARAEDAAFEQKVPGTDASFKMLPIPAGKFMMGSPATEKKRKADEGPQVEVQVDAFFMEEHEVTWAEYNPFIENYQRLAEKAPKIPSDKRADAVTYPTPLYELVAGPILDKMGRGAKFPAVIMSQFAAKQYTKWLSKKTGRFYRLPTEAEWEYACRAGTTTAYSFGDDPKLMKDYGWYFDNSANANGDPTYHEIMSKKPNPWGLYDMHGNVAEWCIDAYTVAWYKQFADKTVKWNQVINWPKDVYPRVIRGGSWNSELDECRSASRIPSKRGMNETDPNLPRSPHWLSDAFWVGFRVISPAVEPPEAEKMKFWDVDDDYTRTVLERDREVREIIKPPAGDSPKK